MAAAKKRAQDPPVQLRELRSQLQAAGLGRGYVLRGEERYFREEALGMLRLAADAKGYEVCVHDAERGNPDFHLNALIDDLSGGGLFADKRLVVMRSGAELLKKVGTKPSALTSAMLGFVNAPDDVGSLVLSVPSLRADHALCKAIKAAGGPLLDLRKLWDNPPPWNPDPRQAELVQWVSARARELKLRLSAEQAVYIVAATGNDLFALEEQLQRLSKMPEEDFKSLVGWDAATTPWSVAEKLVAGELPRALAGIESLFASGFQEKGGRRLVDSIALAAMLIASLGREVRRSLLLSSELAAGADDASAGRAAGIHGRAQAQALARARSRPLGAWQVMLGELAELERAAKSSLGVDVNNFALLAMAWQLQPSHSNR